MTVGSLYDSVFLFFNKLVKLLLDLQAELQS